uniref:Secreted protein n=1 Tax=Ixodes ricinus TaxID=34613 RepID=A0A0K8R407_IXORI
MRIMPQSVFCSVCVLFVRSVQYHINATEHWHIVYHDRKWKLTCQSGTDEAHVSDMLLNISLIEGTCMQVASTIVLAARARSSAHHDSSKVRFPQTRTQTVSGCDGGLRDHRKPPKTLLNCIPARS